jgi:hypothetical protein
MILLSGAAWAAVPQPSFAVPDPRICEALPSVADGSEASGQRAIAATRGDDEKQALALWEVTEACLHRYGYLLAQAQASVGDTVDAVVRRCEVAGTYIGNRAGAAVVGGKAIKPALDRAIQEVRQGARSRIVEAQAGRCWEGQ